MLQRKELVGKGWAYGPWIESSQILIKELIILPTLKFQVPS